MPIGQFFAACRLVIVAGKGGVGKTTVTATLARAAGDAGLNALICEVEGKSGLASMFNAAAFGYDEVTLASGLGPGATGVVRARALTPDRALVEYLNEHGMRRISNRLSRSGVLDVVAAAAPGIDDILVLGKVKQLERLAAADVVLLDAPAAGHAITFLRAARSLLDTVRVGPIKDQARDVLDLLTDATRSQVMLVTLAEETPVNELIDTAYALEDSVGVKLGPVVVNSVLPEVEGLELVEGASGPLADAAAFRQGRMALQREQLARLADSLPLPQIHLPQLFTAAIGPEELGTLANAFAERVHA
jgi:anion-transporting  ArsA/GET3 family ATPase